MSNFIYHERQLGGLCGVHCLNNLLQGPHFGPGDLAEIGVQLDEQEHQLLKQCRDNEDTGSADATEAVEGLPGQAIAANEGIATGEGSAAATEVHPECYNVDPSADGGNFSLQVLTVALGRFKLELLPAKHPKAKVLMKDPPSATDAFLCQYRDHWFAIRKVAGCWWNLNSTRKRPAVVSPFYLAAWLGQLGAEGYQSWLLTGSELPEPLKPQDDSKPEENFHEIFQLLEDAKRSGGNPLAGGEDNDEVIIPPDDSEAAAVAAAFGEPPAGGLYEELLHAAVQALPRPPQELAQSTGWAPPSGTAQTGGLYDTGLLQDMLLRLQGAAGGSAASAAPPVDAGARRRQEAQTLQEMGFREPQIQAALGLARGRGSASALQLLLRVPGMDAEVQADSQRLGRAIQEAVLSLDTPTHTIFGERLLRAVTLLSMDEIMLGAAREHFNGEVLAEFVRLLLRSHTAWPASCAAAASVLVDLLLALPAPHLLVERHQRLQPSPSVLRPVGDDESPVPDTSRSEVQGAIDVLRL